MNVKKKCSIFKGTGTFYLLEATGVVKSQALYPYYSGVHIHTFIHSYSCTFMYVYRTVIVQLIEIKIVHQGIPFYGTPTVPVIYACNLRVPST